MSLGNPSENPELSEQSDGALRVSRRKALYSLQNAMEIHDRLELDTYGKYDSEHTAGNLHGSIAASSDMLAKSISQELDRRDAEYKPRNEVL